MFRVENVENFSIIPGSSLSSYFFIFMFITHTYFHFLLIKLPLLYSEIATRHASFEGTMNKSEAMRCDVKVFVLKDK